MTSRHSALEGVGSGRKRAAVIDLGFNSLKMVLYGLRGSSMEVLGEYGVMARLGEGLEENGYLGETQMTRTIDALTLMKEVAETESAYQTLLVGTSPVREAANGGAFVGRVARETGFRMKVLSAEQEALYSFLGVACAIRYPDLVSFDLGGGSLEMVSAKNNLPRKAASVPLGVLRLSQAYADHKGRISKRRFSLLGEQIWAGLPGRKDIGVPREARLVGVGGTLRAMARYDQALRGYPLYKVHNYELTSKSVDRMARGFRKLSRVELARIEAIGEDRADTIAAGALVVSLLMRKLRFSRLVVSTHGLRDGVLLHYRTDVQAYQEGRLGHDDIRDIVREIWDNRRNLAGSPMVEALTRSGAFSQQELEMLGAALTNLHTSPSEPSPEARFHSFMDLDSELRHREQLISSIALTRRVSPRLANWLFARYGSLLEIGDRELIRKLSAVLRLVELLEKWQLHAEPTWSSGRILLRLRADERSPPMSLLETATASLERHAGVRVVLEVAPPERRPAPRNGRVAARP